MSKVCKNAKHTKKKKEEEGEGRGEEGEEGVGRVQLYSEKDYKNLIGP